jgi:nucleotide-binding universal stress UspA family protein
MTVRRILCPIDFTEAADAALRTAFELAQQLGAELDVLHTWQLSAYASPTGELAKDTERQLQADVAEALLRTETNDPRVHTHVRLGPAAETIVAVAEELGAGMIVMGTSGKRGFERFLVGSVAEEVVRRSAVPVTTVRHVSKS